MELKKRMLGEMLIEESAMTSFSQEKIGWKKSGRVLDGKLTTAASQIEH